MSTVGTSMVFAIWQTRSTPPPHPLKRRTSPTPCRDSHPFCPPRLALRALFIFKWGPPFSPPLPPTLLPSRTRPPSGAAPHATSLSRQHLSRPVLLQGISTPRLDLPTNGAPPRQLGIKLSAALATLTWPAVAAAGLISSIWHISHAARNRLQHSIHGNGTTPLPHRPTVIDGDPLFYAFAGRNRARALHDTNAARHRPPPTRRASQPRRPPEQLAPALGVLLSHAAASLRVTEPLTQGEVLERIFSDGFHIANAHAVDAAPDTAETALPLPPFPAHRRNCSLCAGRHLDTDCELIHGPLPSNRRSCATCSGRHWDHYCLFVRIISLPQPLPFPNADDDLLPAPTTHRIHRPPCLFPQHTSEMQPSNTSSPEARLCPPSQSPRHLPSSPPSPPRPAGPPRRALPTHRTTLKSPTTPASHPSRPRPAQTKSTTLSTTMPGSLAPSRTAATLKCASTTSATFSTLRSYA